MQIKMLAILLFCKVKCLLLIFYILCKMNALRVYIVRLLKNSPAGHNVPGLSWLVWMFALLVLLIAEVSIGDGRIQHLRDILRRQLLGADRFRKSGDGLLLLWCFHSREGQGLPQCADRIRREPLLLPGI